MAQRVSILDTLRDTMRRFPKTWALLASADTHPKGGDAQQAPAPLSGAVGEAETPK